MRWIAVVAVLCLALPVAAGDKAPLGLKDLPTVKTLGDVARLPEGTRGVSIHALPHDVMKALADRFPNLEGLEVLHPGNAIDTAGFKQLERFKKLDSFSMDGDAFLYDDEFALLGRMTSLRQLRLGLP